MSNNGCLQTGQDNARNRATWRGIKICANCGHMNGQRALVCKNEACEGRKNVLNRRRPLEPVQLVTNTDFALYSVRCKERDPQQRNFVQIKEEMLSMQSNASIVVKNVVCFVDTCKFDAADAASYACKHVCACLPDGNRPMPKAEALTVSRDVIWRLNISSERKSNMWAMCKQQDDEHVPAVQRLNANIFAVKCEKSNKFRSGRLHVTAVSDMVSKKKYTHACDCKKLKLILEADNSVIMQNEDCDHILLVLAAILSKPDLKSKYNNFTNALSIFWMTTLVNKSCDVFLGSVGLLGSDEQAANDDDNDIYEFDSPIFEIDHIADFSNVSLNLTRINTPPTEQTLPIIQTVIGNINENSNYGNGLDFYDSNAIKTTGQLNDADATALDLTELCNHLFSSDFPNNISILSPPQSVEPMAINTFDACSTPTPSMLNSPQSVEECATELPVLQFVNKSDPKASEIVHEIHTRKAPPLAAKRALIENSPADKTNAFVAKRANVCNNSVMPAIQTDVTPAMAPALSFSAWLDYVIEIINESIQIVENTHVLHTFHVHEEIFMHFSKSFSVGIKRRLPNVTAVIKTGKYKGLIKYIYNFTTSSTVRRIFSTKNITLDMERQFEVSKDGYFVPYVRSSLPTTDKRHKRIHAKLALYVAFIFFDSSNTNSKAGFKVEWIPNTFPKSKFGTLNVEFTLGIRDPHQ